MDWNFTPSSMPVLDGLVFAAPEFFLPALLAGLVLAALVIWSDGRQRGSLAFRACLIALKLAAIALVLVSLLQPMRRSTRPRPHANLFPILLDNSHSMRVQSGGDAASLGQTFQAMLDEESTWRVRLAQMFDVRTFALDAQLSASDDLATLPLDGNASLISAALENVGQRFAGRPLAGVLLMTDGNETGADLDEWAAASLGSGGDVTFPVYPVVPDDTLDSSDIRLANVTVSESGFETAPVTVRGSIESSLRDDQTVAVRLIDASGKTIQETTVQCGPDRPGNVTFRFRPDQSGVQFYRLLALRPDDESLADALAESASGQQVPTTRGEVTLANNLQTLVVNRGRGPYRVLYVGGRPNWEFKFLRRSLQSDPEIQMVGLLRIANKEPKFSFRDSRVRGTNPLFAGLDDDEAELREQIDEPVILRLGVRASEELSEGFPETADELFAYHAILLDDLEPDFFSQDQMLLLRKFVADRGGGLMLMGGQESFDPATFAGTPLAELSPVYPPRPTATSTIDPAAIQLTREGVLQPWLRLRETETAEQQRLEALPSPAVINPVGRVKPGASELMHVVNAEGQSVVALATQRFGKGRSAAMMVGDWWRTHLRADDAHSDEPAQLWRQITRWLTGEVPRRVEIDVVPDETTGQSLRVAVHVRDEAFLPLDNARVEVSFQPAGAMPTAGATLAAGAMATADSPSPAVQIVARPSASALGVYEATFLATQPGGIRISAKVAAPDGSDIEAAETGWVADPHARELQSLGVDRQRLQRIAEATGGKVIRATELEAFVTNLSSQPVPVTETWVTPIWHQPWVMVLALTCLCTHWGLRRWKGWA